MKVLTYNLSWEAMTGSPLGGAGRLGEKCHSDICLYNVVNYIKEVNKKENLDIIALQEVANWEKILKELNKDNNCSYYSDCSDNDTYNYVKSKSGKEYMVTIYKKSLNLQHFHYSQFTAGRPFQVLVFPHFTLINLHFCGNNNLWCNIGKKLNNFKKYLRGEVICAGDFNYNIWKYHPQYFQFVEDNNYYSFHLNEDVILHVKNPPKSCCNTSDSDDKKMWSTGDFIMSKDKNTKNNIKMKNKIKGLSSDHFPVFSEINI